VITVIAGGCDRAHCEVDLAGRTMSATRRMLPAFVSILLSGCGFLVPEIQDFPGTPGDGQLLIKSIVTSVHCEIANAVRDVIDRDITYAKRDHHKRYMAWFDTWGAQITLSLTAEEKSTLNPTVTWLPPSPATAIFTLGANANLQADATRTEKLNFYYTVAQLYNRKYCKTGVQPEAPVTSLLIQSDLKLKEWLFAQLLLEGTNEIDQPTSTKGPFQQNVLTHDIKFEVVTTGGVNPAWKLTLWSINQDGTLLSATRDRTHELLVVLGPGDNAGLKGAAASSFLASDIALSIANGARVRVVP